MIATRISAGRCLCAAAVLLLAIAACAPAATPSAGTSGAAGSSVAAPAGAAPGQVPSQGAGAAPPEPTRPAAGEVLRIGHLGGGTDFGIILADALGFFQEQGLNVEQVVVKGVPEGLPLLATNQLQVLGGAPSASVFNAIGRGVGVRIVAD